MSYPYSNDHPNVHEAHEVESTPDLQELQQETFSSVDICIKEIYDPVRVYQLPSRIGVSRSYAVTDAESMPLLGADNRRRRATLIAMLPSGSTATGFFVGGKEDVRTGNAAIWPINVRLPLEHAEQVYVRSATTGQPVLISVIAENWAD